jgi:hypothetical protein
MKQKDILLLLVPTFILIIAWVVLNIIHSSVSSTISSDVNIQITPINPSFDATIISKLKQRQNITPTYQITATQTPSPSPLLFSVPTSSRSSSITPLGGSPSPTPQGGVAQ